MLWPSECIQNLTHDHLLPALDLEQNHIEDGEQWRWDRYYNEPCDLLLKHHRKPLRRLYSCFTGADEIIGEVPKMSMAEWCRLVTKSGLVNDVFTLREAKLAFVRAKQTEIDEQSTDEYRKMEFVEFIEAIARIADMRDLTVAPRPPKEQVSVPFR
jgi:hypothetical protein